MKSLRNLLAIFIFCAAVSSAFEFRRFTIKSHPKVTTAKVLIAASLLLGTGLPQEAYAVNSSSESKVSERSFDKLPEGAKKRKALEYCKDSKMRSNAGYSKEYDCVKDVMALEFKIAGAESAAKKKN